MSRDAPKRGYRRKPALRLGARIRGKRYDRGMTLVEVAGRTGFSIAFLSQVERDITTPSLSSLAIIARALGTRIHDFITEPPPVAVHSGSDRRQIFALDPQVISYERLSNSFPGKTLDVIKMIVPAGYRSEVSHHEGEEFVFVLSGVVRYLLSGKPSDLGPGDSLHFAASQPHQVENSGLEAAQVLTVVTQDLFGERQASRGGAKQPATRRKAPLQNADHQDNEPMELSK
jgi:transcriptional regulator with XRE-family HTH domain